MPLFVCMNCNAVENTALANYWADEMEAHEAGTPFVPKCSECWTGQWHGRFAKRDFADTDYTRNGKFLTQPTWTKPSW